LLAYEAILVQVYDLMARYWDRVYRLNISSLDPTMFAFKFKLMTLLITLASWLEICYNAGGTGIEIIRGLNERLEKFANCNIFLRSMDFQNTWIEPLTVPVVLDSNKRRNGRNRTAVTYMSKYRTNVCTVDVYILSAGERPQQYLGRFNEIQGKGFDYADPSFLIFIQHHSDYMYEKKTTLSWLDDPRILLQRMIFVWTLRPFGAAHTIFGNSNTSLQEYKFDSRFYFCQYCRSPQDKVVKHRTFQMNISVAEEEDERQVTLERYAQKMRRYIAWNLDQRDRYYCPTEVSRFNGTIPFYHGRANTKFSLEFPQFMSNLIYPNRSDLSTDIKTTAYNFFDLPNFCFRGTTNIEHETSHGFLVVPVGKMGYNFITCHVEAPENIVGKGVMYFVKFQYYIWIGIISCYTGYILYLILLKYIGKYPYDYHPLLRTLAFYFFEVPGPQPIPTIRNDGRLKFLVGIWLLSLILIVNLYKGVNVSEYTNLWEPKKFTRFLEMENFQFFADEGNIYMFPEYLTEAEHESDEDEHDHHDHQQVTRFMDHLTPYIDKTHVRLNVTSGKIQRLSDFEKYQKIFIDDGENVHDMDESGALSNIQNCNRTAIISSTHDEDYFLTQLNQDSSTGETFYKGKENFIPQTVHWIFKDIPEAQPQARLSLFIETGIYAYWDYWLRERPIKKIIAEKKEKESEPVWEPLSLKSKNSEMFLIFAMFVVSVAFIVLSLIMESLRDKIKREYHTQRSIHPLNSETDLDEFDTNRRQFQDIRAHPSAPHHYLP